MDPVIDRETQQRIRCSFESLRKIDQITVWVEDKIMETCRELAAKEAKREVDSELVERAFAHVISELERDLASDHQDQQISDAS